MAENAVKNEENVNSQSSQLEEEDLQKLEADCVAREASVLRLGTAQRHKRAVRKKESL